ncbi:hypothetical protein [Micromonospora sp. L32]|uniref:hypothetical protein n=1 Tax=Micromonospora TaxID=1873 RepID=UPI003F8997EF
MSDPTIPTPAERAALNAALLATGTETGFWDDTGRPAPWPDDIDEWTPATEQPPPAHPSVSDAVAF